MIDLWIQDGNAVSGTAHETIAQAQAVALGQFERFLLRRRTEEPAVTVDNFVKILTQSVLRLQSRNADNAGNASIAGI